jgi:hypothetical protein
MAGPIHRRESYVNFTAVQLGNFWKRQFLLFYIFDASMILNTVGILIPVFQFLVCESNRKLGFK